MKIKLHDVEGPESEPVFGPGRYVRSEDHEAAVKDLLAALKVAQKACGSMLWISDNMRNYGSTKFMDFLYSAIEDAKVGYDAAEAALQKVS